MLSALDVAYPSAGHPLTGARVPGLFALLRSGRPVLLDTTGELGEEATALAATLGIDVVVGEQSWTTAAVVVVRPDGHVWWASDSADDAAVAAVLKGLGATFAALG
jgi:hypothetical protein